MVAPPMTPDPRAGVIHVHSHYSHDGCDSLERLREFARDWDLAFIGLSDHAEDFSAQRFHEYVAHCRDLSDERVVLIPGLEFRFTGFTGLHLLALGLERWIAPETPEAFVEQARPAAALTVLAHPVLARYRVPSPVMSGIDAVEVWNAGYNTRYLPDPAAIRLLHAARQRRPEVVATVGLDQHDSSNYRRTRVIVPAGEAQPLRALKEGRFINEGRTMSFGSDVAWGPLRVGALTMARWAFDHVERIHESVGRQRRARALRRVAEG